VGSGGGNALCPGTVGSLVQPDLLGNGCDMCAVGKKGYPMTTKPSAESEVELPPITDDVFDNGNGNNGAASIHEDRASLKFDSMWESQRLLGWWLEQRERQLKAALRDKRAAEQERDELSGQVDVLEGQLASTDYGGYQSRIAILEAALAAAERDLLIAKEGADRAVEIGLELVKREAAANQRADEDFKIADAARAVREHGSDYKNGTHAESLWKLVDSSLKRPTGKAGE